MMRRLAMVSIVCVACVRPAVAPGGQVLYLNFAGAALGWAAESDATQNLSSVSVEQRPVIVPPFMEDLALGEGSLHRAEVIASVRRDVAAAYERFDVQVVTERPPSGDFTMIVIGGAASDVDATQSLSPYAGLSKSDPCGPTTGRLVSFVFADQLLAPFREQGADVRRVLAHVAIHEAAHTFGLLHNRVERDATLMGPAGETLSWGAGPVTDQDNCGREWQDDVAMLDVFLGAKLERPPPARSPEQVPPALVVTGVADGAVVSPSLTLTATAEDPSGTQLVLLQTYRLQSSGPPLLILQERLQGPQVNPLPSGAEGPHLLRFTATDRWDNLAEKRLTVYVRR
jgi:hypothetical protein